MRVGRLGQDATTGLSPDFGSGSGSDPFGGFFGSSSGGGDPFGGSSGDPFGMFGGSSGDPYGGSGGDPYGSSSGGGSDWFSQLASAAGSIAQDFRSPPSSGGLPSSYGSQQGNYMPPPSSSYGSQTTPGYPSSSSTGSGFDPSQLTDFSTPYPYLIGGGLLLLVLLASRGGRR